MEFDSLHLHDAVVSEMTLDWRAGVLRISVHAFPAGLNEPAQELTLIWRGLTRFTADRRFPWGPSNSVNSARFTAPSLYAIEMQSGDELHIHAEFFDLDRDRCP